MSMRNSIQGLKPAACFSGRGGFGRASFSGNTGANQKQIFKAHGVKTVRFLFVRQPAFRG